MPSFTLTPHICGEAEGDTLFFLQGWPDDETVWDSLVEELADRYRCVRVTLPNHGHTREQRWGHRLDEIIDALVRCIRQVAPDRPVTLVLHDWGCLYGHLIHRRHPELVHRIVGLDVAPHVPLSTVFAAAPYQWWLAAAFFIGGPVGDAMTRWFARLARAPRPRGEINAWMNYPYRNTWQDTFAGRSWKHFDDYWPDTPMMFVYGSKKPVMFHSQAWLDHVERSRGRVESLPCGHWVQEHGALNGLVASWLASPEVEVEG